MNKAELVSAIASKANVSKAEAERILNAFIDVTGEVLQGGGRISLVGFLNAEVVDRQATTARNPRTGEEIAVPAKKVVKFKVGKALAKLVNG